MRKILLQICSRLFEDAQYADKHKQYKAEKYVRYRRGYMQNMPFSQFVPIFLEFFD